MYSAHQGRGLDARPPDLLPKSRSAPALRQLRRHPSARLHAAVQGFDDTDIRDAFFSGRLRLTVAEDAIGEVDELRRELIALLVALLALALPQAQHVLDPLRIFICRVEGDAALAAHDLVGRAVRRTEAAGE